MPNRRAPVCAASSASAIALACISAIAGCAADERGAVAVTISGQSFALTGWPAQDGGETVAFDDGWTVRWDEIVVAVSDFTLADRDGALSGLDAPPILIDLTKIDASTLEADLWRFEDVPAQRWPNVGYAVVRPEAGTRAAGEVSDEAIEAMRDAGASMYFRGWADADGDDETQADRYSFAWAIPRWTLTSGCQNGADQTDGLIVEPNQVNEAEITFHLDHLFWDNHDAEAPRLLFEPLAAASAMRAEALGEDDDRHVTLEDLEYQDLTDLLDRQGQELRLDGDRIVYRPRAGAQLPKGTLAEYLVDAALSTGHFNGEGHCQYDLQD